MNRLAITLLLAAFSGSAGADWVYVNNSEDTTVYADPNTIRRSGSIVKMWSLSDYKTTQIHSGETYLSAASQEEWDCQDERFRSLHYSYYAKNMGAGKVIFSGSFSKWDAMPPKSLVESLWKFACGKK